MNGTRIALFLAVLAAPLLAPASLAQPAAQADDALARRAADATAVMQSKARAEAVFSASFLAAVSPEQLADLVRKLAGQYGHLLAAEDLQRETPTSGRFTLRFEGATAAASFSIEAAAPNRITGLRITSIAPIGDTPGKIAADFAALPGRSGFAVIELGAKTTILAAGANDQFAIGSVFKLWVLDALAEDIAAGRHRWDEVVRLGPRSLPSGMTQDWPEQAPATVETLATLMISISDNTATDTLIGLVGRERVAARVRALDHSDPARMLPFLTTAESFALKLSSPAVREAYARADDAEQGRQLEKLDTAKLLAGGDITALDAAPTAIDGIEWFASHNNVARVLDSLRQRRDPRVLQILGVAPSLPQELRKRFAYVGYKGGSEVGVISLSWLLRRPSGAWVVVSASWNDSKAAVDGRRFGQLAERLVSLAVSQQ